MHVKVLSAKSWPSCLHLKVLIHHVDGLVQDCSNSIANALELLQSCTKPFDVISMVASYATWGKELQSQYIPRIMHMVCTLLWFGTGQFYP